jgi:hypothetical protein
VLTPWLHVQVIERANRDNAALGEVQQNATLPNVAPEGAGAGLWNIVECIQCSGLTKRHENCPSISGAPVICNDIKLIIDTSTRTVVKFSAKFAV